MALFRTHGAIDNPSNKIKHEKISYPLYLPYQYTGLKEQRKRYTGRLSLVCHYESCDGDCYRVSGATGLDANYVGKRRHHCFAYQMNMMTAQSQLCFDNLSVNNAGVSVRSRL